MLRVKTRATTAGSKCLVSYLRGQPGILWEEEAGGWAGGLQVVRSPLEREGGGSEARTQSTEAGWAAGGMSYQVAVS